MNPYAAMSTLQDDEATTEDMVEAMQALIDSGDVWNLEGSMGRAAMDMIQAGSCMLAPIPHRDYWGSRIPSRYEVVPGSPGSPEFVERGGV